MRLSSVLAAASLFAACQAALAGDVYFNDFDNTPTVASGVSASFSAGAGSIVPTSATYSAYGNLLSSNSNTIKTELTLSNLPTHTMVDVSFLMAFLDSWDSTNGSPAPDYFELYIDGNVLDRYTYNNASGNVTYVGGGTVVAQYVQFDQHNFYSDTVVDMSTAPALSFAHTSSTLTIGFVAGGSGWQGSTDEEWGIDNLRVSVTPVPEPSTYAMMLAGLGMLGAVARRRRA